MGRISGTSFFIVILVIIKSSPETIKQIRYLLNYEVSNTEFSELIKNPLDKFTETIVFFRHI